MVTKKMSSKENVCMRCGFSDCKCGTWCIIGGIVLILLGVLLWMGTLSLNITLAVLLILGGLCSLLCGYKCRK